MARPARLPPQAQTEAIVSAAAKYLAGTSFDRFRLVELARTLEMSHSNIYRFFESKDALFDAVVNQWLQSSRELIAQAIATDAPPLDRLAAMLLALHRSSRDKLQNDPNGFALYEHLWTAQSAAAIAHMRFIVNQGVALLSEAIEHQDIIVSDPLKAASLIQAATAKFHTPALVKDSLQENTEAQLTAVLDALFFCLRNNPESLAEL